MSVVLEPTFYVFVALLIFVGILIWQNIPAVIGKTLDARAAEIKAKLDAAEGLRREAEALLKAQIDRRAAAEKEAAAIIAAARDEAQRVANEARRNLEEQVARRTETALQKISQAEMQAIADVKSMVADVSIAAASAIIRERLDGARAQALVDAGIREVTAKLR